jgi:hypothetical protein
MQQGHGGLGTGGGHKRSVTFGHDIVIATTPETMPLRLIFTFVIKNGLSFYRW